MKDRYHRNIKVLPSDARIRVVKLQTTLTIGIRANTNKHVVEIFTELRNLSCYFPKSYYWVDARLFWIL